MMTAPLGRLIIYTHKIEEMTRFYCRYFGFEIIKREGDRVVELKPPGTGVPLLLHAASKGQKDGQSLIKLVFDVEDVPAFCRAAEANRLIFGKVHKADGYVFANAKDPSKNSIQVSSRAFS